MTQFIIFPSVLRCKPLKVIGNTILTLNDKSNNLTKWKYLNRLNTMLILSAMNNELA